MQSNARPPLAELLWPVAARAPRRAIRAAVLMLVAAALLTVSAKIKVPFYPVPMTLQTLVVLLVGMAYGARLGAATVGLYLALGAAGLPVFAGTPEKGIGLAYILGPTGGYLLGFLLAATVCGLLAARGWDKSVLRVAAAMLAGNTIIYACGLPWLGAVVGWDKPVLDWGLWPFLWGDLCKLLIAALILPPAVRAVRGKI